MCESGRLQLGLLSMLQQRKREFLERQHLDTIKNEGKISTACGDGKIAFVSATDIAAVAFHALTDNTLHETDYRVLGPKLLTYDEMYRLLGPQTHIAAKSTSGGLGRKIEHIKLSEEESVQNFLKAGLPDHYAKLLCSIEVMSANGVEDRMNDTVEKVTERPPQRFDAWVQENKTVWT